MKPEHEAIIRKAESLFGTWPKYRSLDLLLAIADGKWTPEDARMLKAALEAKPKN
jgi:hypothetical protein